MKIITDPTVYGYHAEKGLFIPLDDFCSTPGLIKSLRDNVKRQLTKATSYLDYYRGIHEAGEASSRQQTAMDRWGDRVNNLKGFDKTLSEVKKIIDLK
jgi:hypothetical protein|uniref:Uncharacterized protein n=1 Tax=Siphoviridae sp. ctyU16 TaxID=2827976 RepID=A0A8S5TNV8_9CAUD|nr:MAG TPA: hypothetical protein [Siphoviridae sp. ctyU16]